MNSPAQPDRRAARPRRRRRVGPRARRAGALRRVLRRVHLDRPGRRRSCASGTTGVLAVHSLSKRDNFAGARIGFYAGDAELVHYLREVRKHAGLMPPGPVQAAAVRRARRRRARRGAARRATWPACAGCATCCAAAGYDGRAARRRVLPVGAGAGRRRLGRRARSRRAGRHRRLARRVLRPGRRRVLPGRRRCSPTSASTSPPPDWPRGWTADRHRNSATVDRAPLPLDYPRVNLQ